MSSCSALHQPIKINQPVNLGDTKTSATNNIAPKTAASFKNYLRPIIPTRSPSPFIIPQFSSSSSSSLIINDNEEEYWRVLSHRCYHWIDSNYDYSVCPYQNITQKSLITLMNVLLGTFDSFSVNEENSPMSLTMNFNNGSLCDNEKQRITKLIFHCSISQYETNRRWHLWLNNNNNTNNENNLLSSISNIEKLSEFSSSYVNEIHEPETCEYEVNFYSPIVCQLFVSDRLSRSNENIYEFESSNSNTNDNNIIDGDDDDNSGDIIDDENLLDCLASLINPNISLSDSNLFCHSILNISTLVTRTSG